MTNVFVAWLRHRAEGFISVIYCFCSSLSFNDYESDLVGQVHQAVSLDFFAVEFPECHQFFLQFFDIVLTEISCFHNFFVSVDAIFVGALLGHHWWTGTLPRINCIHMCGAWRGR